MFTVPGVGYDGQRAPSHNACVWVFLERVKADKLVLSVVKNWPALHTVGPYPERSSRINGLDISAFSRKQYHGFTPRRHEVRSKVVERYEAPHSDYLRILQS